MAEKMYKILVRHKTATGNALMDARRPHGSYYVVSSEARRLTEPSDYEYFAAPVEEQAE